MHILAVSYLFPNLLCPNYGIFVLNRLKAVHRHHEVKVINPIPWLPGGSRLARYRDFHRIPLVETIDGLEVHHPRFLTIPRILKGIESLTYSQAVLGAASKLRTTWPFDLVDLHWTYPDLPAGRLLAKRYGIGQVVTVRGREALHLGERTARSWIVNRLLRKSDAVVAVSRSLRDLCESLGTPPGRLHVIGNGVDGKRFRFVDQEDARRRLGLPNAVPVVLAVGSVTPVKGFDRLIASLPAFLKAHPSAQLHVVGPKGTVAGGDASDVLRRQARELGVEQSVHFTGEVANEDLALWYNSADVFCLPSRSEGSPNVLMEALSCGCPAVATNVGAVGEIIADDALGIVVENREDSVLPGLMAAMSRHWDRRCIAHRMTRLDWEDCAQQVIQVYSDVMAMREGNFARPEGSPGLMPGSSRPQGNQDVAIHA